MIFSLQTVVLFFIANIMKLVIDFNLMNYLFTLYTKPNFYFLFEFCVLYILAQCYSVTVNTLAGLFTRISSHISKYVSTVQLLI